MGYRKVFINAFIVRTALFVLAIFSLWVAVSAYYYTHDRKDISARQSEHVTTVIDGDTLILASGERVRLLGIDAPELGDPFYIEARARLTDLVEGKDIEIERDVSDRDQYDRLLRYVYITNTSVNDLLVREGLARAYIVAPDNAHAATILSAEREAQEASRGLWQ